MAVEITDGFRVEIRGDTDLVRAFIQWQLDEKVWAFRGSSSGLGNSVDWFPMEHKEQIVRFFNERG